MLLNDVSFYIFEYFYDYIKRSMMNTTQELKTLLLKPVYQLSIMSDNKHFNIEEATMNNELVMAFYELAINLTKELSLTDERFEYYKKNFGTHSANDEIELVNFLQSQKANIIKNDLRYEMGFRSIYTILNDNINKLDVNYILSINKQLQPFYSVYKRHELLISGCIL